MEAESYFKTTCTHCGGHIEAPAEGAGMWVRCPHCDQKTQLGVPVAAAPAKNARKTLGISIAVLVALAVAAGIVSRHKKESPAPAPTAAKVEPQTQAPTQKAEPEPDLWHGLKPGTVTIEKSAKSRLVYAIGTIRNDTDKQRFGVKVTLDVLDDKGEKLGPTTDYTQFIDAHKEWSFKALVPFPKATAAKIIAITEE